MRNTVNRLRLELKKRYFDKKINSLKTTNNRQWWKEVKSICGFGGEQKQINSDFNNLLFRGNSVDRADVTNVINLFLSTITDEIAAPKIDEGISQKALV